LIVSRRLAKSRRLLVVFGEPAETAGGGDAGPGDRVAARFADDERPVFGELVMIHRTVLARPRAELIDRGQKANALKVTKSKSLWSRKAKGSQLSMETGARVDGLDGALQSAKKHQRRFGRGVEHRFRPRLRHHEIAEHIIEVFRLLGHRLDLGDRRV